MRVVCLCAEPEGALEDPQAVAAVLTELGCDVLLGRFDGGGLDEESLVERPPTLVVVDAGDELDRGHRALRRLASDPVLGEVPTLVAVTLPRLPGLDFSLGADDFVLKPLVPAELYARLRQLDWRAAAFNTDEVIKVGALVIDVSGYEARVAGRPVELTRQEFELLRFLAQNRGKVWTRDQLLTKVWGYRYDGGSRTVDIHIRRLRAKLGAVAGGLIGTVRNVGYKLRGEGDSGDDLDDEAP